VDSVLSDKDKDLYVTLLLTEPPFERAGTMQQAKSHVRLQATRSEPGYLDW